MDNDMPLKNPSWQRAPHGDVTEPSRSHVSTETERTEHAADRLLRDFSVLGQTLVFKGELYAEEDLLIQGRVEGTITHHAQNLTIGAHGNVKADITAQCVIVQGTVHGNIRATESIIVEPSAHVVGNLLAPRIGLKEGAKFKGHIDMSDEAPASAVVSARNEHQSRTQESKGAGASRKNTADASGPTVDKLLA